MMKKTGISTPEGYFDQLQQQLLSIPQREARRPWTVRFAPYAAVAASMAIAVLLGNFILRKTAVPAEDDNEWAYISYLAQALDPDGILPDSESETLSTEDIAAYLIDEEVSVEQLNPYYYEEDD